MRIANVSRSPRLEGHRPCLMPCVADVCGASRYGRLTRDDSVAKHVEIVEGGVVIDLDGVRPGRQRPTVEIDVTWILELDREVVFDAGCQDRKSRGLRSLHRNGHGCDERAHECGKRETNDVSQL